MQRLPKGFTELGVPLVYVKLWWVRLLEYSGCCRSTERSRAGCRHLGVLSSPLSIRKSDVFMRVKNVLALSAGVGLIWEQVSYEPDKEGFGSTFRVEAA